MTSPGISYSQPFIEKLNQSIFACNSHPGFALMPGILSQVCRQTLS